MRMSQCWNNDVKAVGETDIDPKAAVLSFINKDKKCHPSLF